MSLFDDTEDLSLKEYSITNRLKLSSVTSYEQSAISNKSIISQLVCSTTGITIGIEVPLLENVSLNYTSPFAEYANCIKIASLSQSELHALPLGLLAGIFLSITKHFNLVHSHDDILVTNSLLQTAGLEQLVKGIQLVRNLTDSTASYLNEINLDYEVYKDGTTDFRSPFKAHLDTWRNNLTSNRVVASIANDEGIIRIKGSFTPSTLHKTMTKLPQSIKNKENKEEYADKRARAKEAFRVLTIPLISLNYKKLVEFLKPMLIGDNIKAINKETKEKLINRLGQAQMELPIEHQLLISEIINFVLFATKKDIAIDSVSLLETATESFQKPKLSLKELIAQKKARENQGE